MKVTFNPQMKLLWHWDEIASWARNDNSVPILVEISPTNYCNANCPWCFYAGAHNGKHIKRETMLKALSDMADLGVRAISWTGGGEPTLHPNFKEFVEKAHRLKLKQALFTNALDYKLNWVNPDLFEWIRISLTEKYVDGIDKKLLKEYVKSKTKIGICLNLTKKNQSQMEKMVRQSRRLGVDYFQVRPALVKSYKDQPSFKIPYHLKSLEKPKFKVYLSEYKFIDSTQAREYNVCYGHNFCPIIDFDGDVNVCMYKLGQKPYVFGNLYKNSFIEIWHSKRRKKIKACNLVNEDCQVCCKNHEINKLLFYIKNPDGKADMEFL